MFGLVAYLVSVLTMKSIWLRRYFMGVPTIMIEHGKLMEQNMKKLKFDVNDLLEECRSAGYFDLSEIEYAIMEANGKLSILPTGENKPITVKDMSLKPQPQGLCANVVIDGKVMKENLKAIQKSEKWLRQQLKVQGYNDITGILLATVDIHEKLVVYDKNVQTKAVEMLE